MADSIQVPSDSVTPASVPLMTENKAQELQREPTSVATIAFISRDCPAGFLIPPSAQDFDGFREWALSEDCPERGRFSFADGELIIDMSPESIEEHNFAKTEITSVLHARARRHRLGRI